MKIRFDKNGNIEGYGIEIDGVEFNGDIPDDFPNTVSLGKYKVIENDDKTISLVADPGFVMPEKAAYTVDEIQKMGKDDLLALQLKLQEIIDQKV